MPQTHDNFPLGKIVLTVGVFKKLEDPEIQNILHRHANMDWGDVSPETKALNAEAVVKDETICSAYRVRDLKVLVRTEWDRSVTTVLLPSER